MSTLHGPLFTKPRRGLLVFWAVVAMANLAAGIVVALQPSRATDLESVMRWGRQWLIEGRNVYAAPDGFADYPPHAIVLLSPLGFLPPELALPLWVLVNLGLAILSPYLAARFVQPHAAFRTIVLPMLMFLSWWGTHTLTQFSLLALALSMTALTLADRQPLSGGICLGLALIKPQVAIPVLFWSLFTRRWRLGATAVAIVAVGFAAFCVRAHVGPVAVTQRYLEILAIYHTGNAVLSGASELRPLIHAFVADLAWVDLLAETLAGALLAAICLAGFQEGRLKRRLLYTAPPLVACWSLLTFYHLSYGFVVLLPALVLLIFNDAPQTTLRKTLLWVLQIGLTLDLPGIVRHSVLSDAPAVSALAAHADRSLILMIFAGLATLAWRESAAGA